MSQLPEATERMLKHIEAANGGWLNAGNAPCRLGVLLDGYTMDAVMAVNRSEEVIEVAVKPHQLTCRNGEPEILTYRLRGKVDLQAI